MPWWKIKAYKNNLAKKRREDAGRPTEETEHPVMETHPGARVPDPETGEKPKPVRKPRTRKPKPVEESVDTPDAPVDTASTPEKPLTWNPEQ